MHLPPGLGETRTPYGGTVRIRQRAIQEVVTAIPWTKGRPSKLCKAWAIEESNKPANTVPIWILAVLIPMLIKGCNDAMTP